MYFSWKSDGRTMLLSIRLPPYYILNITANKKACHLQISLQMASFNIIDWLNVYLSKFKFSLMASAALSFFSSTTLVYI